MPDYNNKDEIDKIYAQLSPRANELYQFVIKYNEYMSKFHDYDGTGDLISMVEIHLLTIISDNPGITVSQLSKAWGTTKGAISQNINKLEKKELVIRKKEEDNAKTVHIYTTEKGERLSTAHKSYDNADIMQTKHELLKSCTIEEIDTFYKVLHEYIKLF
jgi:DNA-binding MarR family transcriptional regulator